MILQDIILRSGKVSLFDFKRQYVNTTGGHTFSFKKTDQLMSYKVMRQKVKQLFVFNLQR